MNKLFAIAGFYCILYFNRLYMLLLPKVLHQKLRNLKKPNFFERSYAQMKNTQRVIKSVALCPRYSPFCVLAMILGKKLPLWQIFPLQAGLKNFCPFSTCRKIAMGEVAFFPILPIMALRTVFRPPWSFLPTSRHFFTDSMGASRKRPKKIESSLQEENWA